jgi:hypothetical protein
VSAQTAAILLLALAVFASTAIRTYHVVCARRMRRELASLDRREGNQEFLRLLEEMQTMNSRYENFTRRALVAQGLVAAACIGALAIGSVTLHRTAQLAEQQRAGRAVAIDALCALGSAVVDAGRQTLAGPPAKKGELPPDPVGPPRFVHALERLGFPPRAVRDRAARQAARAYGASIAHRVERATQVKGLTRPDGTLNCARLRAASKANPPG